MRTVNFYLLVAIQVGLLILATVGHAQNKVSDKFPKIRKEVYAEIGNYPEDYATVTFRRSRINPPDPWGNFTVELRGVMVRVDAEKLKVLERWRTWPRFFEIVSPCAFDCPTIGLQCKDKSGTVLYTATGNVSLCNRCCGVYRVIKDCTIRESVFFEVPESVGKKTDTYLPIVTYCTINIPKDTPGFNNCQ